MAFCFHIPFQITIVFNCIFYKEPNLDDYTYPMWAKGLGWMIALFPMLLIPIWFFWRFCRDGGFAVCATLLTCLILHQQYFWVFLHIYLSISLFFFLNLFI